MLVFLASPAWGHVTVAPPEAPAGAEQRYVITVPGEKPAPTTRVEIQLPAELRVLSVEAPPGWSAATHPGSDGRMLGATWSGGTLAPGQAIELSVVARNPDVPVSLLWQVIQTYRDGSEVHWNGPANAEFPAATSRVAARGAWWRAGAVALLVVAVAALLVGAFVRGRRARGTPPP